jgi:hypothetical protein
MEAIILNKKFQGPFNSLDKIKNKAGIYLIVCEAFGMTPVRVLEAGNTENIKQALRNEKKEEFLKKTAGEQPLKFLVHYEADNSARIKLKREINKQLHPVV